MSDAKEASHLRFKQLFTQADIDNDGVINGRDAAEFFRRLHLPDGFLKKVCVLSDVKRQGSLSEPEFYTALQLIFLCRLDFATSSDESYIQDWKEILHLLTQHGVIFPVPPPREKMLKIFEETVVKHGIVTGAQVRAIFGRSSLRQDLFSSLCDMFGMCETKIVDDDLFIRFGLAVQLLLHATAMARRARSSSKAGRSGAATPGGATTPGRAIPGGATPGAQWSRPGSATARLVRPDDTLTSVSRADNGVRDRASSDTGASIGSDNLELKGAINRKMADLHLRDEAVRQAQSEVHSAQQSKTQLEQELARVNALLDGSKEKHDQLLEQAKQLRQATEELIDEKADAEALYRTLADHAAQAAADLEKAQAAHTHELNRGLAEAKLAIRERDVQLAKLREAHNSRNGAALPPVPTTTNWQQAPSSQNPTPRSTDAHGINGIEDAEAIIKQVENTFSTSAQDPWAAQPAQQNDWAKFDVPSSVTRRDSGSNQSGSAPPFIPQLSEQHTGGSSISSRGYNPVAPLQGGGITARDNYSDTDNHSEQSGFTNPYSDIGTETPRCDFLPPAVLAQLGSSISINIENITLKGIRRLNKPFVSVCVVDSNGCLLAAEQATNVLSVTSNTDDLDSFIINKAFEVPIPDDGALASSCAMIFKLRHLQKRTGAPVSRCWAPVELRDILHQSGTQNVTVGLYQKPTDLKRKRMRLEGKQSKLVLQVTAPDMLGEDPDDPYVVEPAAPEEVRRVPTAEELERAIELFNEKPKRGLQYLTDNGFIRPAPNNLEDIVNFLMSSKGMSKAQIGQYLGTRGDLPEAVLTHFVFSLDFVNKKFDDCVRLYFKEFFPPGEADPIYRMMEKFGQHFASVNEGLFESDDAPLVLAYAVLMLNTDLHNTAITSKITQDQFIHNLRGCNNQGDIDREFLAEIYQRVQRNEIKMKDQDDYRGGRPAGTSWRPAVIKRLTGGAEFKKYGRAGNPHDRWVYVTPDLQHVCYASKFGKATEDQMIPVRDLTRCISGMETAVFERQVDEEQKLKLEKRCFSLDAGVRTLDLLAKGEIECKQFYDAYRFLVAGYLTD